MANLNRIMREHSRHLAVWTCCLAVAGAAVAADPTLTNQWTITVGNVVDSSPAVGKDGTIYFGAFDGKLWAVGAGGQTKWKFQSGREIKSSPALGQDETIYFGSRDRKFYALRPNGTKKWEFSTGGWVDSSAAVSREGTVYFGSWDKTFYALNSQGAKEWQFQTAGPIVSSPAIGGDGAVYFGSHDAKLYALNPAGEKKWEFATRAPIVSSPAVNGTEGVYFTSLDGYLYALNLDGSLRWKLHTGGITESSPVIGQEGMVYLGVNTNMWSITPAGVKAVEYATHDVLDNCATAFADGSYCFISRRGLLVCLTSKRELKWARYVYGQGYASPGVGAKGTLYLQTFEGQQDFSALIQTEPLANSAWPKFRGNSRNTGNVADPPQPR